MIYTHKGVEIFTLSPKALDKPPCAAGLTALGALADAVPESLAQSFVLFSKTGSFSPNEIELAKTLNSRVRRRVILWSRDELEPFYLY